jgi:hypothetical protein
MKGSSVVFSLILFLSLWISALSFPAEIKADEWLINLTQGQSLNPSQYTELASADQPVEKDEEKPLFESIIMYLIIFTPVLVITLIVWIFCRIIKLTKRKE